MSGSNSHVGIWGFIALFVLLGREFLSAKASCATKGSKKNLKGKAGVGGITSNGFTNIMRSPASTV